MTTNQNNTARDVRAEIYTKGVTAALLINGGAAIALLTFLQTVWDKKEAPVNTILVALGLLASGVFCAALVHPLRYWDALRCQYGPEGSHKKYLCMVVAAHALSLLAFVAAVVYLVCKLWRTADV